MDMARGNEFGRLTSDIVAAIRAAGPSPDANARLAVLLKKAKEVSFPKDRLDATFAKAQGGSDAIHTATYEALGAEGVAFIIECATDSPARTHAKVKELFNRGISAGSKLSSVGHLFGRRGVIRLSASKEKFDDIFKAALDAGAEDIRDVSEDVESEREANQLTEGQGNIAIIEILSEPANIQKISQALAATDHELLEAEQRTLPTRPPLRIRGLVAEGKPETVPEDEQYGGWVSKETIGKLDKFIEALKESADCHKVWWVRGNRLVLACRTIIYTNCPGRRLQE